MSELESKIEIETEEFVDELSDEALDRGQGPEFGFSGHQGHWCWSGAPR